MRCVHSTLMVCCGLLFACTVDRVPLASEQLQSDSGESDAVFQWRDARQADVDAADAYVEADSSDGTDAAQDAEVIDAGSDASYVDAGSDAQQEVDAKVPTPRYVGPCVTDHDCELDEVCVRSEGLFNTHSYCAQRCTGDVQCTARPLGADPARCTSGRCRLPCDAVIGAGCPSTMTCQDLLLILPADDGTCTFQE